jgi:hypothetical protein
MLDEINTMAPANENAHNYFHRIWDVENRWLYKRKSRRCIRQYCRTWSSYDG